MIIKKLNFSFYKKIKKLIFKNGFNIPSYQYWIKLWKKNKNRNVGDGIIIKNKLVGYHSYFEKKLIFKNKIYKILVSSNWNVDKKYRKFSIFLINNYFKSKNRILITTTSNFNVSKIWKSFGAEEVNNDGSKSIYFKILSIAGFINIFLIKQKNLFFNFIKPILIILLYFYLKFKINKKHNSYLNYASCSFIDKDIEKFNKKYEKNNHFPMEKRSNYEIRNYINVIKHNKEIFILKIYKQKKLIGYIILAKEKFKEIKVYRMYLAEIRINKNYLNYIDDVFEFISEFSKKKNCVLIEFRNLNKKILNKINKNHYFLRKIKHNPYLVKFTLSENINLRKYIKKDWETSFLDGDCLL
tara:strand:- start:1157 stop:2221 length:1065 start_codon:yes stop_codon:yes gene_type:complete